MGDFDKLKYQAREAYRLAGGNVQAACSKVGISRKRWNEWLDNDETFREWIDEISEGLIDYVESKLLEKIKNDDTSCIQFFLKTKGKKRGYSERTETQLSGPGGGPILGASVNFQWLNEELPASSAMAALQKIAELEGAKYTNIETQAIETEFTEGEENDATSAP